MTEHKQHRIRWDAAERATVLQRAVEVLRDRVHTRVTDTDLLRAAQQALPHARRRKIVGATATALKPLIASARALAKEPIPAPPPEPTPAPPPPTFVAPSLGQIVEVLADAVADRIVLRLLDAWPMPGQEPLSNAAAARLNAAAHERAQSATRASRPGVLIVGLLGAQAAQIMRMFPHLDISTLTTDEALKRDLVRRAHNILMTKFISHSVQEKYRKAPDLHLCSGGLSELADILQSLARSNP